MRERYVGHVIGHRAAVLALLVLAGCGSGSRTERVLREETELGRHRALWQTRSIQNYDYTLRLNVFAPPGLTEPVRISVRSGETASVTPTTESPYFYREFFQKYDTIPELFALLQDAEERKVDRLSMNFNAVDGYPTSAFVDYDLRLADEEIGFVISEFVAR